jgi:hypothetical protein
MQFYGFAVICHYPPCKFLDLEPKFHKIAVEQQSFALEVGAPIIYWCGFVAG